MTVGLRPVLHPGQAETLVHFCGRPRQPASLGSPRDRLENILFEGRIAGTVPFGSPLPAVCFSESDRNGIQALIECAGFEPWGVVVSRSWVWEQGGGPVWYVRDDLWDATSSLSPDLRRWLVRTRPSDSDWLHEREWRVPVDPGAAHLRLPDSGPLAIIVGDENWEPQPVHTYDLDAATGSLGQVLMTPVHAQVERWLWAGGCVREPVAHTTLDSVGVLKHARQIPNQDANPGAE